jgi:hypothetical protein
MKPIMWAVLPFVLLAAPVSAAAQKKDEKPAAAKQAEPEVEAKKACKKKKGLGGLLRAARSSGLVSVVAGQAGTGGALVNSVASTAIDVADAGTRMAPPEHPKC